MTQTTAAGSDLLGKSLELCNRRQKGQERKALNAPWLPCGASCRIV